MGKRELLHSNAKAKVWLVEYDGGPVVQKQLVTRDAYWVKAFRYEATVNRAMARRRLAVPSPRLLAEARCSLWFEYVPGQPLSGDKYPVDLDASDLRRLLALHEQVHAARFPPRVLRRVRHGKRLRQAVDLDLISRAGAATLGGRLRQYRSSSVAHGDFLPRNVLRTQTGLVLLDWELATLAPPRYDLALLWLSLLHQPGLQSALLDAVAVRPGADAFLASLFLLSVRETRTTRNAVGKWDQAEVVLPSLEGVARTLADRLVSAATWQIDSGLRAALSSAVGSAG